MHNAQWGKRKLLDRMETVIMKKMDCAWEEGIPGSNFNAEVGRSWFIIRLRAIDSTALIIDPMAIHTASASCLKRITPAKSPDITHLLCPKPN